MPPAHTSTRAAPPTSQPLVARGTLTPAAIHFADTVVAELEVAYDPALVDGGSIRVEPDFAPFVQTAPPTVSHGQRDGLDVLRMRYSLQCVTARLPSRKTAREMHLRRVTVTGLAGRTDARGRRDVAGAPGRLTPLGRAATGEIAFRHQRDLPAPTYRVPAGALAGGLIATAALALLAAFALLVLGLRHRAGAPARRRADGARACAVVCARLRDAPRPGGSPQARWSSSPKPSRAPGDDRLAGRVRDAAWVETPPTPSRSTELADDVETAAVERS